MDSTEEVAIQKERYEMLGPIHRRSFLASAAALAAMPWALRAAEPPVRLKKALKYGMIGGGTKEKPLTILDRFELAKKCGFEGVELDSPSGINREEVVAARDRSVAEALPEGP